MQRPSEQKRRKIADAAARLFAGRPFHEVRLDDVAAAARVGKGTLYVYFKSKEDLYASLLFDAFSDLVERLRDAQEDVDRRRVNDDPAPPRQMLGRMVGALVGYAFERPFIFELMRFVHAPATRKRLAGKRAELLGLIEQTIRAGNDTGCWTDDRPDVTAVMVPGLVRSAVLYGPKDVTADALSAHIFGLLTCGLGSAPRKTTQPAKGRQPKRRRLVSGGVG